MSRNERRKMKLVNVYSKRYNLMMEYYEKLGIDTEPLKKLINSTIKLYTSKY